MIPASSAFYAARPSIPRIISYHLATVCLVTPAPRAMARYAGANDYIWVEDVDDRDTMTALTRLTCQALQDQPKKRRK